MPPVGPLQTTRVIVGCLTGEEKLVAVALDVTGFGVRFKMISLFELVVLFVAGLLGITLLELDCEFKPPL